MQTTVALNNENHKVFYFFDFLKNELNLDLKGIVKETVVKKSEFIYQPNTVQNNIYEVVDGVVKLGTYSESGEEHIYDIISSGDFFGNLKYLNNQFYEFSKALIDTHIRIYDLSFFKKVIIENPKIAEWFISYLVKRWCVAEKKLAKINEKDTIEKIRFLKHFFNIPIKDSQGSHYIVYDLLTQKDMGDLIGTTRQTISNTLKKTSILAN